MRKTTAILSILAPVMFALPAHAEIASQQYVDDQKDVIISGTDTTSWESTAAMIDVPQEDIIEEAEANGLAGVLSKVYYNQDGINSFFDELAGKVDKSALDDVPTKNSNNLVKSGGVYDILANTVGKEQVNGRNGILVTDGSGTVYVATGGHLTNSNISSSAAIEMGKIAMPTPPAVCENAGCMLMYVHGQYTWEVVTRNTGETPTVTAANAVSATPTQTSDPKAYAAQPCGNNQYWNGSACEAFAM